MKPEAEIKKTDPGEARQPTPYAAASGWALQTGTIGVFLLACGLIATAARGDLWLDEIWSIMFATSASSPKDIFFRFQHDNNHLLHTLYLYVLGRQEILYIYRLPAVAAGIGSIWLVGLIAQTWGRTAKFVCLLFAGTSFPLILYFSESRGYAPSVFFALSCFALLARRPFRSEIRRAAVFSSATVLGILSHATFVIALPALLCLLVAEELTNGSSPEKTARKAGLYFIVPFAFSVGFYFFFIRHIQIDGGPIYPKWEVVCRAASMTLGLPEGPFWGPLALAIAAAVLAAGTVQLYRDGSAQWIFYPVAVFVAPALLVVCTQPTYLYFRYFIVCIPFFYLLLGYLVAAYFRKANRAIRCLLIVWMVFFAAAQSQRIVPLLQLGRGNYRAAIEYILSNTANNRIGIGSDHDFRNKVLLAFYTMDLPDANRLYYVDQADWKKSEPQWIITHRQNRSYWPAKQLVIPGVGKYTLIKEYRFAGISGWHWFLYRHDSNG